MLRAGEPIHIRLVSLALCPNLNSVSIYVINTTEWAGYKVDIEVDILRLMSVIMKLLRVHHLG